MKKFLNPVLLTEYIEALCAEKQYPDKFKQSLLLQVQKLKEIYGDSIPKDDFLTLMSQQQNALNTGYRKKPVDVLEFLISTEYLNLGNTIRPKIKEALIDIFGPYQNCYEIVLSGGTRLGKTYLACAAYAYHIYRLSCLYNPQTYYELSPGSEIVFSMQSLKEEKAKRNFREFRGMIADSPYFKKYFPLQGNAKNYAIFPNNIKVMPFSSQNNAAMSENIFCAFIDEANFMQVIKGSKHQALDEQYYDQATTLYRTIKDRIQNQFKDFATGEWPGKIYLASSANHKEDFIQNKKKEAKKSDHIYVMDYALWEVKDTDKYCGKKFWVQMPTELESGKILNKKPQEITDDVLEVPIEFKTQFEEDLHVAIRNIAGKPLSKESKFIPSYMIMDSIRRYNRQYLMNQIFTVQEVVLNDVIDLASLFNLSFIKQINPHYMFHSHCDMALSHDSAGIVVGANVGGKVTKREQQINMDTKEVTDKVSATAPIYAMFGVLRIVPPDNGQIDIAKVEKFYLKLKKYLTNFKSFSSDRAYSITLMQNLKKNGIATQYITVDKTADAYTELKNTLTEKRCWISEHEKFKEEVKYLMFDTEKNKIDHHPMFSKDVADAVAGTTIVLSNRKSSYKNKELPLTLEQIRELETKEEKNRPKKMERVRSNNRPKKWGRR